MPGTDRPQYPRPGYTEIAWNDGTYSYVNGLMEVDSVLFDYKLTTDSCVLTPVGIYLTSNLSVSVEDGIITKIDEVDA